MKDKNAAFLKSLMMKCSLVSPAATSDHKWQILLVAVTCFPLLANTAISAEWTSVSLVYPQWSHSYIYANSISDSGRVAGYFYGGLTSPTLATVWSPDGQMQVLPLPTGAHGSNAVAILNDGSVVANASFDNWSVPAIWSGNSITQLPVTQTIGGALAAAGNFIGGGVIIDGAERAALWDSQGLHAFTSLPGATSAISSVNSAGYYVGGFQTPREGQRTQVDSFIGTGGSYQVIRHPGTTYTGFADINDKNVIAGNYAVDDASDIEHSFFFDNGSFQDLELLAGSDRSFIGALDDEKTAVGFSALGEDMLSWRATAWFDGSSIPTDLNMLVDLPGIQLIYAKDINNAGQILVEGLRLSDQQTFYYILTPVPEATLLSATLLMGGSLLRKPRR